IPGRRALEPPRRPCRDRRPDRWAPATAAPRPPRPVGDPVPSRGGTDRPTSIPTATAGRPSPAGGPSQREAGRAGRGRAGTPLSRPYRPSAIVEERGLMGPGQRLGDLVRGEDPVILQELELTAHVGFEQVGAVGVDVELHAAVPE